MDWKKLAGRLLFPPFWLLLMLTAASAVLLTLVFVRHWEQQVIAYFVYALAFYTLCVVTVYCIAVLPKQYRVLRQKLYASPLGNRFLTDRAFRTKISLCLSLGINIVYVLIHLWSWQTAGSWWFMVLAVYYCVMAVMRFLLAGYVRTNALGGNLLKEWGRARLCACILLLVNLSLSAAVLMILYKDKGYDYPGVLIYVMALYTFFSTAHAIVDIIKYRRLGSPVMSTAKIVSLSAALVSMLNLETAMFAQFGGDMARQDQDLMIILTGAGISVTVVTASVLLIVKATKEIRRQTHGK